MHRLATELQGQNRTLSQLKREGLVALYLICNPRTDSRVKFLGYELAVIQLKKFGALGSNVQERYPDPDQKPKQSWHYEMSERHWAEKGFEVLVAREKAARVALEGLACAPQATVEASAVDWTSSQGRSHGISPDTSVSSSSLTTA